MAGGTPVALVDKTICEDLLIARFERPEGYAYRAGQWFRLTLETSEGAETRTFSHASAPADEYLELATRVSGSTFKQTLALMEPGDTATLAGPGGRLSLPEPAGRTVFLVGGVGITPVRGLLRDAAQRDRRFDDAVLIYGNRGPACAAYLDELMAMADRGVRTYPIYEAPPAEWEGETGFITEDMVARLVGDLTGRPFVVAGPPIMVSVMTAMLERLGIGPDRLTIESFGRPASVSA